MRVHLAILIFSLVCGPAMADEAQVPVISATVPAKSGLVSIGRPHVCTDSYPPAAVKDHAEGMTTLAFTITTTGTVKDIKVAKSSGNIALDDASVQCASHWLYKPAAKDSQPVDMPWEANVVWKIGETPAVRIARHCLNFRESQEELPKTIGITTLSFRIQPDGSITDAAVTHSSGDASLDHAAVVCVLSNHYDTSIMTLPAGGVPGHVDLEWGAALTLPSSDFVRPKPLNSHMCSLGVGFMPKKARPAATILNYIIGVDGNVSDVHVAQTGGNDAFDNEAAICAAKWRYEPATQSGHPVVVKWAAEVEWQFR
jgi:TonB family protein